MKKLKHLFAALVVAFFLISPTSLTGFSSPRIEALAARILSLFKRPRQKQKSNVHNESTQQVTIVNDFLEAIGTYALSDEIATFLNEITISVNGKAIKHGKKEDVVLSDEKCVLSLSISINTLMALLQHEDFKILFDNWDTGTFNRLTENHWLTRKVFPHLKNEQSILRKIAHHINSRIIFTYTFSAKELSKDTIAILMIMILKYGYWEENNNWPTIDWRYRPIRTVEITLSDNEK